MKITSQVTKISTEGDLSKQNLLEAMESWKKQIEGFEAQGWSNLSFEFTVEYESDDCHYPILLIHGERDATPEEETVLLKRERNLVKAKELGITPYELEVMNRLISKGIL